MEELKINATQNTPLIHFDPVSGKFLIEGRSIHENPDGFYMSVLDWLDEYFTQPAAETLLEIKLEYLNSGSTKFIMEILRQLKKRGESGLIFHIKWYYEEDDEALMDLGHHFIQFIEIPMEIIPIID